MLRLKELRTAAHLKQQAVANAIGISRGAYSNLQNGKRDPDTQTLVALASFFHVSVDHLLNVQNPDDSSCEDQFHQLAQLYSQLTPQNVQKASSYMKFLLQRQQSQKDEQT